VLAIGLSKKHAKDRLLMDIRRWFAPEVWRLDRHTWILVSVGFTSVIAYLTTPWAAPGIYLLFAGTFLVLVTKQPSDVPASSMPPWLSVGLVLCSYILLSLFWSDDRLATLFTALFIALLLIATHLLLRAADRAPDQVLQHATRCILIATILGLLFLFIEEASGHAIKRALYWPFRALQLKNGGAVFDPATVVLIHPHVSNWNMPLLAFTLWPAILICDAQLTERDRTFTKAAILLTGLAAIFMSKHWTSMFAIAAGCAVFAMAMSRVPQLSRLLQGAWLASFLVVLPLASTGMANDWHRDDRLKPSFRERIVLWGVTAERFWSRPLLGVGAASTVRTNHEANVRGDAVPLPNSKMLRRTGPHAHNFQLQSLYELGVIGSLIFASFGLFVIDALAKTNPVVRPYLLAMATTMAVMGLSSFGLFERWFLAAFALSALVAILACAYDRRVRTGTPVTGSG
jgi:O-Antigen ligase